MNKRNKAFILCVIGILIGAVLLRSPSREANGATETETHSIKLYIGDEFGFSRSNSDPVFMGIISGSPPTIIVEVPGTYESGYYFPYLVNLKIEMWGRILTLKNLSKDEGGWFIEVDWILS